MAVKKGTHAGKATTLDIKTSVGPGPHTFEYAITLRGDAPDADLVRASQDYRTDYACGPAGIDTAGLLDVQGEAFAFSALKGAEDGKGVILRIYNPTHTPTQATLTGAFALSLALHRFVGRVQSSRFKVQGGPL